MSSKKDFVRHLKSINSLKICQETNFDMAFQKNDLKSRFFLTGILLAVST
jgi:hypothetical protein